MYVVTTRVCMRGSARCVVRLLTFHCTPGVLAGTDLVSPHHNLLRAPHHSKRNLVLGSTKHQLNISTQEGHMTVSTRTHDSHMTLCMAYIHLRVEVSHRLIIGRELVDLDTITAEFLHYLKYKYMCLRH